MKLKLYSRILLAAGVTMTVLTSVFVMYVVSAKAENNTDIYEGKIYEEEYLKEILEGNNSLSADERNTLVKAYQQIDALQAQIDNVYKSVNGLEERLSKDLAANEAKELEEKIRKSTLLNEAEKEELIAGYKEMDELQNKLYPLYEKDTPSSEEKVQIEDLEKKLDKVYERTEKLEERLLESGDISPVMY